MSEEKTTYTPGPWEVFSPANGEPLRVKTVYGTPYMDDSELTPVMMIGRGKNQKANARLIAAAPEFYEALKTIEEEINNPDGIDVFKIAKIVQSSLDAVGG